MRGVWLAGTAIWGFLRGTTYIYIKVDISLPKIEALHSLAIGVTAALVIYFDKWNLEREYKRFKWRKNNFQRGKKNVRESKHGNLGQKAQGYKLFLGTTLCQKVCHTGTEMLHWCLRLKTCVWRTYTEILCALNWPKRSVVGRDINFWVIRGSFGGLRKKRVNRQTKGAKTKKKVSRGVQAT